MKIDLRHLYSIGKITVDEMVEIPKELYENMDVIHLDKVSVKGTIRVNYDELELDLDVTGSFVMKCAVSLEDVNVPFKSHISQFIAENEINNDIYLDLLDILWENIVLEIPLKVVKEGIEVKCLHGEGWELSA